jgi:scyllo-inositol 2-dehydrogenase (NADP+)
VTTPNATHVPLAMAVLRCGRHLVVDKPVVPSAEEARAVAAVAADQGAGVHPVPQPPLGR